MRILIGLTLVVVGVCIGAILFAPAKTVTGTPVALAKAAAPAVTGPDVGDCVTVDPASSPVTAEPLDCADPAATYEVTSRTAGSSQTCPTKSYDPYLDPDGEFSLCLMINGREGDCFTDLDEFTMGHAGAPKSKVPCTSGGLAVVTHRFDRVDPAACGPDSQLQLVYPDPAPGRTLCVTGGGF